MTAIGHEKSFRLRLLTSIGFWASSAGGLLLPWAIMLAIDISVHHLPFARAWRSFTLHLFAPGYNFFLIGILLFSGSLYAMTLLNINGQVGLGGLGILTPIGGLFFILGWLMLLWGVFKNK